MSNATAVEVVRRCPVRRPGADHPGDPGPLGRVRGHRDRRRRSASTRARRSGWSPRSSSTGWSSRSSERGQVPPRRRAAPPGRRDHRPARRRAGGAAALPAARRRHRRDGQHRRALERHQRALPRPGRRLLGAAVAQLGRPAHPAARHQQRQGAARPGSTTPSSSDLLGTAARATPTTTITSKARAAQASWRRSARQGYAVAVDELEIGLTAIAAARSATRTATSIASMSVSGPDVPAHRRARRATSSRCCVDGRRRGLAPARLGSPLSCDVDVRSDDSLDDRVRA